MTAAAVDKLPFADASPAELRDGLIPEERAKFDEEYQHALAIAGEELRLDELDEVLDSARRRAILVHSLGADGYRKMIAKALHIKRTGEVPADSVPLAEVKALIQRRLLGR